MTAGEPFGGAALIADTSAWARAGHPAVRDKWSAALRAGQLAVCSPIVIELLFAARDHDAVLARQADLAELRSIAVTASVQAAAIGALVALSARGPGQHRVPAPELLIAAAAQESGRGVLHYDRHYDRLAEVLSFESRWLAPPGSL
jgi:predicted nucleic acid-binding protein